MAKLIVGVNDFATWCKQNHKESALLSWNYALNDKKPNEVLAGTHTMYHFKCNQCGYEFEKSPHDIKLFKGNGCKYCGRKLGIANRDKKYLISNNLVLKYSQLLKEWDYEKNKQGPDNYAPYSNKQVWWKCEKGHVYRAIICDRTRNNSSCPYCTNKKVLVGFNDLTTTNPDLIKEWDYEKNTKLPQDYVKGSEKTVFWICSKGHKYSARINNRVNGTGCPYCANKKIIVGENDLSTTNPELVSEWHPIKNGHKRPEQYSKGSKTKIVWVYPYDDPITKKHFDFEWVAPISSRTQGYGCPYLDSCTSPKLWVGFNDLETRYPQIAKEWHPTKNTLKATNVLSGSGKKVWWLCPRGHSYESTVLNRTQGRDCPYCANKRVLLGYNDLSTINPDLASEWNYEKNGQLTPQNVIAGSTQRVWWHCKNGHDWYVSIVNRNRGSGCPYCSGSKAERLTYKILKEWNIPFRAEKKFEQDIRVKYYPYDVWISKVGLLIELDGMQHFQYFEGYFEQGVPFEKRVEHDNIKNQFAFEKRIPLLRIPYTYNPDTEEEKIRQILKEFIETRKIPQEIIEYYEQYDFSNYSQIAKEMNEL